MLGNLGLHLDQFRHRHTGAKTYTWNGSIPATLCDGREPTRTDIMGGRVAANGLTYEPRRYRSARAAMADATKHGAAVCCSDSCACAKIRAMGVPNVRFWVYWADGPVKLTLRPGQSLTAHAARRTDEGWSSETDTWTHDYDRIARESGTDGVDCDGRLSRECTCEAKLHELAQTDPYVSDCASRAERDAYSGVLFPYWDRVNASQRDYSAEAMGY